jgi:hypothetical protein
MRKESNVRRHWAYLKTVLRHKFWVFWFCLQFDVPIWTALLHDWDKFLPDEWFPYARTFYKPDGTKQYVESPDFAHAWMLHQHRNKHHWQYWLTISALNLYEKVREGNILVWDRGVAQEVTRTANGYALRTINSPQYYAGDMPPLARQEMLADWFGAGRAYNPDWDPTEPRKWYEKAKEFMKLSPHTREWVERELLVREEAYLNRRSRSVGP